MQLWLPMWEPTRLQAMSLLFCTLPPLKLQHKINKSSSPSSAMSISSRQHHHQEEKVLNSLSTLLSLTWGATTRSRRRRRRSCWWVTERWMRLARSNKKKMGYSPRWAELPALGYGSVQSGRLFSRGTMYRGHVWHNWVLTLQRPGMRFCCVLLTMLGG